MTDGNQELFDAVAAEPEEVVDLTTIRRKAVELRDTYLEKTELEEKVKKLDSKITDIERKDLPDMFAKAKISSVTVEADGNHPAFIAERDTVYTAKIPDDKRQQAFQWFESQGHGDLIKSVIAIIFGMQEHERRLEVMEILNKHNIKYHFESETIHHMTLKGFVKKQLKAGNIIPMDLLGAYIFDEVKIK